MWVLILDKGAPLRAWSGSMLNTYVRAADSRSLHLHKHASSGHQIVSVKILQFSSSRHQLRQREKASFFHTRLCKPNINFISPVVAVNGTRPTTLREMKSK